MVITYSLTNILPPIKSDVIDRILLRGSAGMH